MNVCSMPVHMFLSLYEFACVSACISCIMYVCLLTCQGMFLCLCVCLCPMLLSI